MARTRKKAVTAQSPVAEDTTFNPAEFETPREQAAAIVQEVAQSMALPDTEREAAHENGHAARHAPQRDNGQSHADSVGKRERQPGYTQPYTDRVIGAHRLEHRDPYYSIIRFDEKPSDDVRATLRETGFDWETPMTTDETERAPTYHDAWKRLMPVCKELSRLIMECPLADSDRMMLSLLATASLVGTSAACIQLASPEKLPMQDVMKSIFDAVTPALMEADGRKRQ